MNRKYFFLLPAFVLLTCLSAGAQEYYISLGYSISAPLGETQGFIEKFSWRGANFEGQWFLQPDVSLGFYWGWNLFNEKLTDDFEEGTRTVSGTQLRYLNAMPVMAEGHYYLGEDGGTRPYLGVGVGTTRTWQRTEMGILAVNTNQWQFSIAPAVGVLLPVGYGSTAINLGLRYNYAFQSGDALEHSYLGINIGFAWLD